MKLIYLANARIPTEKAHGRQIMKMCEAFVDAGLEVELEVEDVVEEVVLEVVEVVVEEEVVVAPAVGVNETIRPAICLETALVTLRV